MLLPTNRANKQVDHWIKFAHYGISDLVQNSLSQDFNRLKKMGGLLEINWWNGLRLGNWHFYEEALSQHIELHNLEYDILAGISGTVAIPVYREECDENRSWMKLLDNMDHSIPLYIWHYLKSSGNQTNSEVVIIGVNTPFYEVSFNNDSSSKHKQ